MINMEAKTKRILKWIWCPFGVIVFIALLFYVVLGLILQPLIGINSYLHNWDKDRKLEEEIKSAELFVF